MFTLFGFLFFPFEFFKTNLKSSKETNLYATVYFCFVCQGDEHENTAPPFPGEVILSTHTKDQNSIGLVVGFPYLQPYYPLSKKRGRATLPYLIVFYHLPKELPRILSSPNRRPKSGAGTCGLGITLEAYERCAHSPFFLS